MNTRGIVEVIFCFHVNRNLVLSDFVLAGFHSTHMCVRTLKHV